MLDEPNTVGVMYTYVNISIYMQYDWELYTEACGYLYVVPQSHEYWNQFYQSF